MTKYIEKLPWDSDFFELTIGRGLPSGLTRKNLPGLLDEAQSSGLDCLYYQADPNDPQSVALAEQNGFHLVDVRVVLEHPFDDRPAPVPRYPIPPDLVIGPPNQNELPHLQDISAQIGQTSRFEFDKHFAAGQSERLYRLWIDNACRGFADIVLIARWNRAGVAVGLITCTYRDGVGHIQLAGVHTDHRQRGVGTGLVQAALDWSKAQGGRAMEVVTQARNVPAQRLYQQMGFFTKSMTLYYHKWFEKR